MFLKSSFKSFFEIGRSIRRNGFIFDTFLKILMKCFNAGLTVWILLLKYFFFAFLFSLYQQSVLVFLVLRLYWLNSFLSLRCLSFFNLF